MSNGKPKTVDVGDPVQKSSEPKSMSAVELIADAEANIKANAGKDGLTPQAKRALQKLATARQLLGAKQGKPGKD